MRPKLGIGQAMGGRMALPRGFLTIFAVGLTAAFASRAAAAGCDETGATHVEIARVTDDLDIILKDERAVRLAGVKAFPASGTPGQADAKLLAGVKEALAAGPVSLRLLTPIADRWGRVAGDLFVGGKHLQSTLAKAGLVVARPDDLHGACWEAVKAAEAQARRGKDGLWAASAAILPASDGAKLSEHDGLFILAAGEVRHVSRGKDGKARSFVDFGARGANALYLSIDAKALTRMEKLGFNLDQLSGHKILVRGVVLNGRAPHMVIDDLDAIEFWD
ncbi:MAG: thermonuclease family protein [Hyphomicrobiales bacterium]|nr:thermonuclease family protein [Hyphomicrobiales bacterium]